MGRIARGLWRPLRHAAAARLAAKQAHAFPAVSGPLARHLETLSPSVFVPQAAVLRRLLPLYLEHRFNLLGSGWVKVAHGETYAGFGSHRYAPGPPLPLNWRDAAHALPVHRDRTRALLAMISPDYVPFDWQVDFKSGWRWDPCILGVKSPIGHKPGADIKVPWELARLQHFPALAGGFALGGQDGFAPSLIYAKEFRDQVLDFISFNPAGFGVNWSCTMDVAIRAANVAIGWDLFRALGAEFDNAFEETLASCLLAHGRHVWANLEWHAGARANHYLANIAGLSFIAAYLPQTSEARDWLEFAAHELDQEICFQFLQDGAGFEGSTAYHGLSGELAVWAAALLAGKGLAIGEKAQTRLAGALCFSRTITKPDGNIVQVGDNDSGHLFKLVPLAELSTLEENHLSQRGFQSAAETLLGQGDGSLEAVAVRMLTRGHVFSAADPKHAPAPQAFMPAPAQRCVRTIIVARVGALETVVFPDFGLYLWRGNADFIAVRCGRAAYDAHGAHAHNDQLSVELFLNGVAWTRDPGSFIYTADQNARDRYRSVKAHFAPRGRCEPGDFSAGPFRLKDRAHARMHVFNAGEFLGAHDGFGKTVFRRIRIERDQIVIEDLYGGSDVGPATAMENHVLQTPAILAEIWNLTLPFSSGYGVVERASMRSR